MNPAPLPLIDIGHDEAPLATLTGQGERVHLASSDIDLNTHIQDAARELPTTYILTVDKGGEPEKDAFYGFYKRAEARGWPVMIMEGDHVVHLTKTGELVDLLEQVPQAAANR